MSAHGKDIMNNIDRLIQQAFEEDLDKLGDITTLALFAESKTAQGRIICKTKGILSGLEVANRCFYLYDKSVVFKALKADGDLAREGEPVAEVKGHIRSLLAVERVALNFISHLSGIATLTNAFVEEIKGTDCRLKDTRKTTPGLRSLEKMAVKHGQGTNHRQGLYDGVLIKDNHLEALPIARAISLVKEKHPKHKVEVEVETLEQVKEALSGGADILLLDNMGIAGIKEALSIINGKAETEASGGVSLENALEIAKTGADYISTSAITMSAPPLDVGFELSVGGCPY